MSDLNGSEVFLLLSDNSGTTFSRPTPFGVAVTTEKEAKRFVKDGYSYHDCYQKVVIFDNKDDALKHDSRQNNSR